MIIGDDVPVYTIGITAGLLGVHPETLRIWERQSLIRPARRGGQRLYSANDVKRLRFVKHLTDDKGLNLAGVRQVVEMYPCWWLDNCPGGMSPELKARTKACWKEHDTYCHVVVDKADLCGGCRIYQNRERCGSCARSNRDS
ncbi:MAG: MerR family transcriptional regulator [Firmicutes bacterium]|nr:MerR family transcriptional regulator [Bacillota bacterium]